MNTAENNKKIAEFLGVEYLYCNNNQANYFVLLNEFKEEIESSFHNDWNLLMQVVEKIESIDRVTVVFETDNLIIITISTHNVGEKFKCKQIHKQSTTKIEAIYNACIEFIDWYNKSAVKEN